MLLLRIIPRLDRLAMNYYVTSKAKNKKKTGKLKNEIENSLR